VPNFTSLNPSFLHPRPAPLTRSLDVGSAAACLNVSHTACSWGAAAWDGSPAVRSVRSLFAACWLARRPCPVWG
jgi:hypothetical protein